MRVNCQLCGRYIDDGGSGETICETCRAVREGRAFSVMDLGVE